MKRKKGLFLAVIVVAALALGFLRTGKTDRGAAATVAERLHTRYDPGLGWSNVPRLDIPDMYGPGLSLRTNGQGFRNNHDFGKKPPPGKTRVICSGDSFTLGYGVDQNESWCAWLERLDKNLETVNMGQGGYGVDQSYLWYVRDGRELGYDVHLFTFIFTDFERMKHSDFFGYAKPALRIDARGNLEAVPAAPPRKTGPRKELSKLLRFRLWLHRFGWVQWLETELRRRSLEVLDDRTKELTAKIFESLKAENRAKGARLVLVYLPAPMDREKTKLDDLRAFVRREAARQGIDFLDFTENFRALDRAAYEKMYLRPGDVRFAGAEGHYTKEGNAFVASLLRENLGTA